MYRHRVLVPARERVGHRVLVPWFEFDRELVAEQFTDPRMMRDRREALAQEVLQVVVVCGHNE
jgi:hypothetical protein